jgi:hypothetical protein
MRTRRFYSTPEPVFSDKDMSYSQDYKQHPAPQQPHAKLSTKRHFKTILIVGGTVVGTVLISIAIFLGLKSFGIIGGDKSLPNGPVYSGYAQRAAALHTELTTKYLCAVFAINDYYNCKKLLDKAKKLSRRDETGKGVHKEQEDFERKYEEFTQDVKTKYKREWHRLNSLTAGQLGEYLKTCKAQLKHEIELGDESSNCLKTISENQSKIHKDVTTNQTPLFPV